MAQPGQATQKMSYEDAIDQASKMLPDANGFLV